MREMRRGFALGVVAVSVLVILAIQFTGPGKVQVLQDSLQVQQYEIVRKDFAIQILRAEREHLQDSLWRVHAYYQNYWVPRKAPKVTRAQTLNALYLPRKGG